MYRSISAAFAVATFAFALPARALRAQQPEHPARADTTMRAMPGMAHDSMHAKRHDVTAASAGRKQPPMAGMSDTSSMARMAEPLGIPHTRMGSGTSWVPDASPVREYTTMAGPWMLMAHGDINLYYDHQGTVRGDDQVGSANWLMFMAMRNLAGGMLQLNTMLSAEPFTVGPRGYPLLLQSGEAYQGEALHDRQHPHDLFMELSARYERAIAPNLGVSLYAAPVGEPALGPVAFMHRPSAQNDPFATIAHHWQDVTHVSFGVATVGVFTHGMKLEGSWFNGREPDGNRYDFDFRKLDSYSGRLSVNPTPHWSLNASYGFLKSPEELHPDQSQHRIGASIMHTVRLGGGGEWASALIYGANQHRSLGQPAESFEHSAVLESNLQLDDRNSVFGRVTFVQKSAEDLVVSNVAPDTRFNLGTLMLGYVREIATFNGAEFGLGFRGEISQIPATLLPTYGTRHPAGIAVFGRIRPRITVHAHEMDPGMHHSMGPVRPAMSGAQHPGTMP